MSLLNYIKHALKNNKFALLIDLKRSEIRSLKKIFCYAISLLIKIKLTASPTNVPNQRIFELPAENTISALLGVQRTSRKNCSTVNCIFFSTKFWSILQFHY